MRTIQVSHVQMNEILFHDAYRWRFLELTSQTGARNYQPVSPFVEALEQWRNTSEETKA